MRFVVATMSMKISQNVSSCWRFIAAKVGYLCFTVVELTSCKSSSSASHSSEPPLLSSSWQVFRYEELPRLSYKRWILVLHRPTRTLIDSMRAAGMEVVRVYAPEHGLFGESPAGAKVSDTTYQGIPISSLYGKNYAPPPQQLREGEAILFALRDVGVRHYTYLSTLAYTLRAAAEAGRPVWILDFPNPHAHYTYGPLLDSSLFSFVGLHATPLVPGLTIGEYAQLLIGEGWIPRAEIHVVPWKGWKRSMLIPSDSPFYTEPPSPALRSPEAIELYPILGWYEATCCVSIGRGTDSPFLQVGLIDTLPFSPRDTFLYGYKLKATQFKPTGSPFSYKGWRIHRAYEGKVRPDSLFRLGFALLRIFRRHYPDSEGFYGNLEFFDKLFGTPLLRWMEMKDLPVDTLYVSFMAPPEWQKLIRRYQAY